jgi:hypothetical protein
MSEIHLYDVGTNFIVTIHNQDGVLNISGVLTKSLIFSKPDHTSLTVTPSFVTNGSDGKLSHIMASGDLNVPGWWQLQGHVSFPSGSWNSTTVRFLVYPNLS